LRFLNRELYGAVATVLIVSGAAAAAQEQPLPSPPVLTIGDALRAALARNPDLLDAADALAAARSNERGVASTFLPQVTPFYSTERERQSGVRTETYGASASELFPWGTLIEGTAAMTRNPVASPDAPYASDYRITLTQPLLRAADPAVTREPLRQAKRSVLAQSRALEIVRRRTVLAIYQAYLGLARQEEARRIAADRVARARQLTEFSRARFAAGSVSRLDVLRAEQQEASAVVAENDASNLVEDFRDALRRAAGLTPDLEFSIAAPAELPQPEPPLPESLADLPERRPEALEARDQIRDAEFAVRIAKSLELPSISGVLAYDAGATGASAGDALHPRNPSLLFGVRSQYGLNIGILAAQRRQAEITLTTHRRDARLLEEDLAREVRRAYRRLDALARDYRIASQNQQVAELQARVAQLRFEKGLSDNFNVVDAENLLNAARLLELDSRFSTLLARLDCLYSSGRLNLPPFLEQP
jgi:outer membrane protein TolC